MKQFKNKTYSIKYIKLLGNKLNKDYNVSKETI